MLRKCIFGLLKEHVLGEDLQTLHWKSDRAFGLLSFKWRKHGLPYIIRDNLKIT
jgi:hypothetical protein